MQRSGCREYGNAHVETHGDFDTECPTPRIARHVSISVDTALIELDMHPATPIGSDHTVFIKDSGVNHQIAQQTLWVP